MNTKKAFKITLNTHIIELKKIPLYYHFIFTGCPYLAPGEVDSYLDPAVQKKTHLNLTLEKKIGIRIRPFVLIKFTLNFINVDIIAFFSG